MHAAYVEAALVIKQFNLRRAENMLLREGVPQAVIARVLLVGEPLRKATRQFGRNNSAVEYWLSS